MQPHSACSINWVRLKCLTPGYSFKRRIRNCGLLTFGATHKLVGVGPDCPADQQKLSGIQSPLFRFDFRYYCLPLSDASTQFQLSNIFLSPRLHEKFNQSSINNSIQ
jgi:hypothetical protein